MSPEHEAPPEHEHCAIADAPRSPTKSASCLRYEPAHDEGMDINDSMSEDGEFTHEDVSLYEGLLSTRSIRRYTDDPIPPDALRDILFAATRAPSGSNRQPFRFLVLTDTPTARQGKALVAEAAQRMWATKARDDGYDRGSGQSEASPKRRMAMVMQQYVDRFADVPVMVLACYVPHRPQRSLADGASVFPACQNLLLAARALGFGGVMTGWHQAVSEELHELLDIPDDVEIAATITLGVPAGQHGPVRRRPMSELVFGDKWGEAAPWAHDPPGTRFTAAGPPPTTQHD